MKLSSEGSNATCERLNAIAKETCIVTAPMVFPNGFIAPDNTFLAVATCKTSDGGTGVEPRGGGVCWNLDDVKFLTPCKLRSRR